MVLPAAIFSALRTDAFNGSKYVSDFLSGKIEVFQLVLPMVTITGREPHPLFIRPKQFVIIFDCFFGTDKKCQAPADEPWYNQTFALILNRFVNILINLLII